MSDNRTSPEQATVVSHFVHMAMGLLSEVILPVAIGVLTGYTVSLLGSIPAWVISMVSISSSVVLLSLSHRMTCMMIKSSAPCALEVASRVLIPMRGRKVRGV